MRSHSSSNCNVCNYATLTKHLSARRGLWNLRWQPEWSAKRRRNSQSDLAPDIVRGVGSGHHKAAYLNLWHPFLWQNVVCVGIRSKRSVRMRPWRCTDSSSVTDYDHDSPCALVQKSGHIRVKTSSCWIVPPENTIGGIWFFYIKHTIINICD